MIAMWMLYALVLAVLFGCAAWLVERSLIQLGRPTRWVWVVALIASVAVPPGLAIARSAPVPAELPSSAPGFTRIVVDVAESIAPTPAAAPSLQERIAGLDPVLFRIWLAASLLSAVTLLVSHLRLRGEMAGWPKEVVDGEPVRVSPEVGPAVVGAWKGVVVLPSWARALGADQCQMIVRHEMEHLAAGDVRLLGLAALAVVALPWNIGIWWLRSRLRDALELDCDRRLVRSGTDPLGYASLLFDVALRRAGLPIAAVGLTPPRSLLSRRIDMLTSPRARPRLGRVFAGLASGAVLVLLACEVRPPLGPPPGAGVSPMNVSSMPVPRRGRAIIYPQMLREAGINGLVILSFVVGADSQVDAGSIRTVSANHPAFESAAIAGVRDSRYWPAMSGGKPVSMRVQQEILFAVGEGAAHPPKENPVREGFMAPISVVVRPHPLDAGAGRTHFVETKSMDTSAMYMAAYRVGEVIVPNANRRGFVYGTRESEGLVTDGGPEGPLRYPSLLLEAGIEGQAEVEFFVDAAGKVDPASIKVLSATHGAFRSVALRSIADQSYTPEEVGPLPATATRTVKFTIRRDAKAGPTARVQEGTRWVPVNR